LVESIGNEDYAESLRARKINASGKKIKKTKFPKTAKSSKVYKAAVKSAKKAKKAAVKAKGI